MPSTREEIRFHMKERDPPAYLEVLELTALLGRATIKWVRFPELL